MTFIERIQADLKNAMLGKESDKVRTLRMLIAKLREKKIELKRDPEATDEIAVLKKAAKERQDSIETYIRAGRQDLADVEQRELELIRTYLPEEMSDAALAALVAEVIRETGAASPADMGRVMGAAMKAVAGRADGKRVQAVVK
ncbi:MAG: GatB/YqeY domain-containing protein, partial [FCB group bacterium]|nr:GatB/YqeY domain-containing protein [FCB group bacterium]